MKAHYNLYCLFREDQKKNPLSLQKSEAIQKFIEKYFKKIKPP